MWAAYLCWPKEISDSFLVLVSLNYCTDTWNSSKKVIATFKSVNVHFLRTLPLSSHFRLKSYVSS